MELHLDRKFAERRIFPAIHVEKSGTRKDELLIEEKNLSKIVTMRRMLEVLGPDEGTPTIIDRLAKAESNDDFLTSLSKG